MKNQPKVSFQVTVEQANVIFKALGKLPFEDVYELIGSLNEQANQQLQNNTNGNNLDRKNLENFLDD